MLADALQDIRYAARVLMRGRTFTSMSALTLALGIGATTAIFSLVWAVVLAPLPYSEPDRLVRLWEVTPRGDDRNVVSAGNVVDWQERAQSFAALGAHTFPYPVIVTGEGGPAFRAGRITVHPEVFAALDVSPVLGRALTEEDEDAGDVVVIGHAFWQGHYGGDPDVLGRRIVLEDLPYTVVGVMPEGFSFPSEGVDLYRPFNQERFDPFNRTSHNYQVVARLAPGATAASAQTEMTRLAAEIAVAHPEAMTGWSARVVPLHDDVTRSVAGLLWVLLGGVAVVLVITCANIANLLLARAVSRQREIAVRGALGAGRGRILRQLLTESVLLTAMGGVGALAIAPTIMDLLVAAAPADVPLLDRAAIDARMLAFTAATALSCALLFGLAPALRLARAPDLQSALRTGRDTPAGHMPLRGALLAGQVALSVVLLVAAGLLVRSFQALQGTDMGFDPEGLVLMDTALPQLGYPETPEQTAFFERLIDGVAALRGVTAAAGSSQPPASPTSMTFSFAIEGRTATNASGREDDEQLHAVTPGYFETLSQAVVSGRTFGPLDGPDATPVVVFNETLARKHFPDGDAIGHRISFRPGETPWREIVGVVADARLESPDVAPRAAIFVPFAQKSWQWLTSMTVIARTERGYGDPSAVAEGMRAELLAIDPDVPPLSVRTVEGSFRESTARRSFAMTLVAGFGLLALVLSIVGLYALITYSVARERREIGVRIALGAHAGDVVGRVLRRALGLTALGALLGLAGAATASRLIEGLLFRVSPVDAPTYAIVVGLMLGVALATTALPALRAARTDPMAVIRTE